MFGRPRLFRTTSLFRTTNRFPHLGRVSKGAGSRKGDGAATIKGQAVVELPLPRVIRLDEIRIRVQGIDQNVVFVRDDH